MDYRKEMIEYFRSLADRWEDSKQLLLSGELNLPYALRDAATTIETLLAEREAAVEDLHGRCDKCAHENEQSILCRECVYGSRLQELDNNDYWQWRGPTPPDRQQAES